MPTLTVFPTSSTDPVEVIVPFIANSPLAVVNSLAAVPFSCDAVVMLSCSVDSTRLPPLNLPVLLKVMPAPLTSQTLTPVAVIVPSTTDAAAVVTRFRIVQLTQPLKVTVLLTGTSNVVQVTIPLPAVVVIVEVVAVDVNVPVPRANAPPVGKVEADTAVAAISPTSPPASAVPMRKVLWRAGRRVARGEQRCDFAEAVMRVTPIAIRI